MEMEKVCFNKELVIKVPVGHRFHAGKKGWAKEKPCMERGMYGS